MLREEGTQLGQAKGTHPNVFSAKCLVKCRVLVGVEALTALGTRERAD